MLAHVKITYRPWKPKNKPSLALTEISPAEAGSGQNSSFTIFFIYGVDLTQLTRSQAQSSSFGVSVAIVNGRKTSYRLAM